MASDRVEVSEPRIEWEEESVRSLLDADGVSEETLKEMVREINARVAPAARVESLEIRVLEDEDDMVPMVQIVVYGLASPSRKDQDAALAAARRFLLIPDDLRLVVAFGHALS